MGNYDEISNEELKSLTSAIKKRYGIDFTNYETKSLKRGFGRLLTRKKLDSLLSLWNLILKDREFFYSCIDELTVNLTEMFRNHEVWEILRMEVKKMFSSKTNLNIWHAGCSTGEEVYTMLFILNTLNYLYKSKIIATDLSSQVIQKAKSGVYSKIIEKKYRRNFNNAFPDESLDSIIKPLDGGGFEMKNRIKDKVDFKIHNLVCDKYPKNLDIIFCRNVMIYFDDTLKMKAIKDFHKSLNTGGLFIIGFYDMLPKQAYEYFEVYNSQAKILKKI